MKKITKILLVVFAIALLSSAICMHAFASEPELITPTRKAGTTNSYQILDAKGNVLRTYNHGASDTNALVDALGNAADGQTIKLLGDILMNTGAFTPPARNIFIDLNGYIISNTRTSGDSNPYLFNFSTSGAGLTIYSSDTSYQSAIYLSAGYDNDLGYSSQALFYIHANNCTLRFGTPIRDASGNVSGYTDCNVSTFSSTFLNVKFDEKTSLSCTGTKIELYGGNFARTINSVHNGLIQINGEVSFSAKNSNIYAYSGYIFSHSEMLDTNYIQTASAEFDNCFFYSHNIAFDSVSSVMSSRIKFKDCDFVCKSVSPSSGVMNYTNCRFSSDSSPIVGEEYKINLEEDITLIKNQFSYSNLIIQDSSYDIYKSTTNVKYTYVSNSSEYAVVTWKFPDKTVTEKWVKGSTPIPPVSVYPSTEVYRYELTPATHVVNDSDIANGVTYEMKPTINFNVKANLALYSNFVYNIYLPKTYVDSGDINYALIAGKVVTPVGTKEIDGADYYVYEYEISAIKGDEVFTFQLNVDGYQNKTFTRTFRFSIPSYVNAVNEGNYPADTKALVNATMTYIKAAKNYAALGDLPYPPSENPELSSLVSIAGEKVTTPPSKDYLGIFYGARICIGESINIRFEIYNVEDAKKNVIFSYRNGANSAYVDVKLTADDWTATTLENGKPGFYYDLPLAARDLRDPIYVTLGTEQTEGYDCRFSIDNYIYELGATGTLKTLLDALYAYSVAAENYLHAEDGVSTPTITIGKTVVSSENYVIVAPSLDNAAALKLQAAIEKFSGEALEIITTDTSTTKNKIIVDVTTPNTDYDFIAKVDGKNLKLSTFKSFIDEATDMFIKKFLSSNRNRSFDEGFTDILFTDKVYYSDFGAVSHKKPSLAPNYNDTTSNGTTNIGTLDSDVNDTEEDKAIRAQNFKAIKETHDFANLTKRHTVYADSENPNPIYWIKEATVDGILTTISIKTNVDWTGTQFYIDNSCLNPLLHGSISGKSIISINPDQASYTLNSAYIAKNSIRLNTKSKNINLVLGYDALIVPIYDGHRVFRRKGYGAAAGSYQTEIVVIDAKGKISEETPVMWDYADLTSIGVYKIDKDPTTITGGTFTTIASQKNAINYATNQSGSNYYSRNISIARSNTTLIGVKHYTENEISFEDRGAATTVSVKVGAPQNGFYNPTHASHITLKDCVLTGQRCYIRPEGGTTGTYDFGAGYVNKIVLDGCIQSNFWVTVDKNGETHPATETTPGALTSMSKYKSSDGHNWLMHWGIGGTNFCKNMEYRNSTLSRFDAHQGLYNGKIIDSTVQVIALTGMGDMEISNTKMYILDPSDTYNNIIHLRSDYGCTWDGEIKISNLTAYAYAGFNITMYAYTNWDYGYTTAFPSLSLENIRLYYINTKKIVNGAATYTEFAKSERIDLSSFNFGTSEQNLHLETTASSKPYRAYRDYNNDKIVDDYDSFFGGQGYDFNKDGVIDDKDKTYNSSYATTYGGGILDTTSYENLNPVKPPEYIYVSEEDRARYTYNLYSDAPFFDSTLSEKPEEPAEPIITVNPFDTPVIPVPFR